MKKLQEKTFRNLILAQDVKGLIEKAEESMTKMAPHSSASSVGSLSADFERRTLRTLQELFADDTQGKARAEKKPSFDLGEMDE